MFRPPASAHGGRARAFRRSDRRRWRRFSPNRAEKPRGGGFTRVCTQNFVYKKSPARKILAGDGGERLPPAKQGQSTKSPEMPSKSARPDQRRAKRGIPSPNGQQIGRKWAVKCRHAVCPSGRGQIVPRWRRSANNAASSPRKRRRFRPRSPFGTCKICHPGGTHRLKSSNRAGTCWESVAAPPRAHVSPRRAARAASSPASPLAHGRLLTISDHDTTIPAQKQAILTPSQRPPFRAACQPVQRRPWLNPAGIRNRRDLGEIRQSVLRLVLPCLPRRARNLRQRRRLSLAQVRKLAPVLEPALDCVPPVANVREAK